MKTIRLKSLTIENLGGLAKAHFDFDNKLTKIQAPTGSGKTTIIDSIFWGLGKSLDGIFPTIDGYRIKNLTSSAEIELEIDGSPMTFKRVATQVYVPNRDDPLVQEFKRNDYEYYINAYKVKSTEYENAVADTFGVDYKHIDMLLYLSYFNTETQTWKPADKRKFLMDKFNVNEQIATLKDQPKYELIRQNLEEQPDELLIGKLFRDQHANILKQLEDNKKRLEIMVQEIAELKKIDFGGLENELKTAQAELTELATEPVANPKLVELQQLQDELQKERIRINAEKAEIQKEKLDILAQLDNNKRETEIITERMSQAKTDIEDYGIEINNILEEHFDEKNEQCHYCGQKLPVEKIAELKANFESSKEKRIADIEKKRDLRALDEGMGLGRLNTLANTKSGLVERSRGLLERVVSEDKANELEKRISDLSATLEKAEENDLSNFRRQKIKELQDRCDELSRSLGTQTEITKKETELENLKVASRELAQSDNELIIKQRLLKDYIAEKIAKTDETVNQYFNKIRWNFYKWNSAGAQNEYSLICSALLNGTDYVAQSTGEKIFTDIAVHEGICKALGINVFKIIDDKGSMTLPYETESQVVELITRDVIKDWEEEKIKSPEQTSFFDGVITKFKETDQLYNAVRIRDLYSLENCDKRK